MYEFKLPIGGNLDIHVQSDGSAMFQLRNGNILFMLYPDQFITLAKHLFDYQEMISSEIKKIEQQRKRDIL